LRYGGLLARKRLQAARSRRQLRFLDQHARQTFLDGKLEPATLAHQAIRFRIQARAARWIERTAENIEKLFGDHEGLETEDA
jgi:hypothetical protein